MSTVKLNFVFGEDLWEQSQVDKSLFSFKISRNE